MEKKLRIYYAGSGKIAVDTLLALARDPRIDIVGIGTQPDRPVGRKRILTPTPVGEAAAKLDAEVHKFENFNTPDALEAIARCKADMIVVFSFGQLLKQQLLDLPPMGCINIHGSLLPRWRGASPIQQVLLHGETETGICFMQMERGLDSGPVYSTFKLSVPEHCGAAGLEDELGKLAASTAAENLLAIAGGEAEAVPQDEALVTVCRKITREEGMIDWHFPARKIENMCRAYEGWPGAYCKVVINENETLLTLNDCRVIDDMSGVPGSVLTPGSRKKLIIACGEGALEILKVTPSGRKVMDTAAFLNGVRDSIPEFPSGGSGTPLQTL